MEKKEKTQKGNRREAPNTIITWGAVESFKCKPQFLVFHDVDIYNSYWIRQDHYYSLCMQNIRIETDMGDTGDVHITVRGVKQETPKG